MNDALPLQGIDSTEKPCLPVIHGMVVGKGNNADACLPQHTRPGPRASHRTLARDWFSLIDKRAFKVADDQVCRRKDRENTRQTFQRWPIRFGSLKRDIADSDNAQ
jgi:hypothetical protein